MLVRLGDIDRSFRSLDEFRRRMTRLFDEFEHSAGHSGAGIGPEANIMDNGESLVVRVDVPGMSHDDITLNMQNNVLTISGERKTEAPEGYSVHRKERGRMSFSRSYRFPTEVDAEKANATLIDGILTVSLPKTPAAMPRKIDIKNQ